MLCAGHAAADRIGDAVNHLSHGKAAIEAEAEAARVAPGGLAEIEGVQGAAQAGLEVPEDGVDPAELRQLAWIPPSRYVDLGAAARSGDREEAGQAIGEHRATSCQVL